MSLKTTFIHSLHAVNLLYGGNCATVTRKSYHTR